MEAEIWMKFIFSNFQRKGLDKMYKICYNYVCCEILAQSVEHTPFKCGVEGSSPSYLTNPVYHSDTLKRKPVDSGFFYFPKEFFSC